MTNINDLKKLIEEKRRELNQYIKSKNACLTDPEIIRLSQELDELLNRYHRAINEEYL